jgi:hypothetical protein
VKALTYDHAERTLVVALNAKRALLVLLFLLSVGILAFLGYRHGVASAQCGPIMQEVIGRLGTTRVKSLPKTCSVGDFVLNIDESLLYHESRFYMCIAPNQWAIPNRGLNYPPQEPK